MISYAFCVHWTQFYCLLKQRTADSCGEDQIKSSGGFGAIVERRQMPVSETLEEVSGWLRGCCGEVRERTSEGGRGAPLEGARGSGRGGGRGA